MTPKFLASALVFVLFAALASTCEGQTPPNDSDKYHVIVVTSPVPTPAGANLIASMAEPSLAKIVAKCKPFRFISTDPVYSQRYAAAIPPVNLPIVALVRSDGGVIYKSSGPSVLTGSALARKLTEQALADRRANPRPIAPAMPAPQLEADDCPDCPNQPSEPFFRPDRPRRPLIAPIPDTLTIVPSLGVSDSTGYAIAAIAGLVIVGMLGFAAVIGVIAFAIYAFMRN